MPARLRKHLTFANVASGIALFVSVGGGTAFAVVAANQVNSTSIIDGQVKKPDLAANSVGTGKVIDNSLTGADITESTLGTVPLASNANHATSADNATNATAATNADTVDGKNASDFLGATAKAVDADKLDGVDSTSFAIRNGNSTNTLGYDVHIIDMATTGSDFRFGGGLIIRTAGTAAAPAMKVCVLGFSSSGGEPVQVTTIIAGVRATDVVTTGASFAPGCTTAKAVASASEFQIFGRGVVVSASPALSAPTNLHHVVGLMN